MKFNNKWLVQSEAKDTKKEVFVPPIYRKAEPKVGSTKVDANFVPPIYRKIGEPKVDVLKICEENPRKGWARFYRTNSKMFYITNCFLDLLNKTPKWRDELFDDFFENPYYKAVSRKNTHPCPVTALFLEAKQPSVQNLLVVSFDLSQINASDHDRLCNAVHGLIETVSTAKEANDLLRCLS